MIRVLLVEDNPGDARLVEERLREDGSEPVEVERAPSLAEAEASFERDRVEAVLLDLNLPDVRGLETVRRAAAAWPETPIVVLTGEAGLGLDALQAGADDYLEKDSITSSLLWKSLRYSIERKRAERLRREGERFHRRTLDGIPVPIVISRGGRILYVNPAAAELLGADDPGDLVGVPLAEIVPPEEQSVVSERVRRVEAEGREAELRNARIRRRDGGERRVEVRSIPVEHGGERATLSLLRDVTEERRAVEALRSSEERLARVLETVAEGILIVAPDGTVEYANAEAAALFGVESEDLLDVNVVDGGELLHSPDARIPAVPEEMAFSRVLRTGKPVRDVEYLLPVSDGPRVLSLNGAPLRDDEGEIRGVVISIRDVTERQRMERELERLALYDPLTGLPNRTLFQDRLRHALEMTVRGDTEVAVLFLDLDRFKVVNDSLGHAAGDQLLSAVAARLRESLRGEDTVARFGGDEFAVLVERVSEPEDVRNVARRVVAAFDGPFEVAGNRVRMDASVGIASSEGKKVWAAADLLRFSDIAMYRVKERDGTHFHLFDPSTDTPETDRLFRENELWRALEEEEFALRYQPTVRLDSGAVVGAEALVRWDHPGRGILLPVEFIPLAEETGLIVQIGEWVLRRACRDVAGWKARGDVGEAFLLSVNVSARQYREPDFAERMLGLLEEGPLAPEEVQLEITESVLVTGSEKFARLRRFGVRLAIDDFGTGYSSLTYLKSLQADVLKIDRSFVMELDRDSRDRAIVGAILLVAREIGLEVVAEGIETAAQRARLRELGCWLGQGFHFARPMRAEEFRKLLAGEPP